MAIMANDSALSSECALPGAQKKRASFDARLKDFSAGSLRLDTDFFLERVADGARDHTRIFASKYGPG